MRRPRQDHRQRRGAAMVEGAIILMVFLTFVFGMIDLSIAVFRHHVISQASRQGVRQAVVHGELAPDGWNGGPWGPATYTGKGTDTDPIAASISPFLAGLDRSEVDILVEWPDGNNQLESRVRVTVSIPWRPIMLFIFGSAERTLTASTTMPIAH